jgi:hypothetical protein
MLPRPGWTSVAIASAVLLCSCGGGADYDGRVGACVVDGTKTCTNNVSAGVCQQHLHGDHFYEARSCSELGFPH